jgi:hypothetical protein
MTINNNNIFGAFTLGEVRSGRLTGDWLNKEFVANYGWFGGGSVPATVSTVDRIDFSNDSATASVRGPLSAAKYGVAATGNSNYGWFGGGAFFPGGTVYSTVDRIDFSNDSSTASQRGPLTLARFGPIATGNSNYGWFGGGSITAPIAAYSTVDRIDFSNDSSTASQRGPLTLARYGLAATGNSNYGWFGGGITAASVLLSTVDRIDFSNDSSTASQRGPLSSTRYRLASTGNSNYGWFGGGNPPTALDSVTIVNRIDFSNDSAAASVRGPLTLARYSLAATGNSNYGWFGGGYNFSLATKYSSINRIDFSNDSVTASLRGGSLNAPAGRYFIAATSGVLNIRRQKAGNYGWFGGGFIPPVTSRVDRIDFSNDSSTALVRGSLNAPAGRRALAATGNSNYGWFGGGAAPAIVSTVDRIDFSNDSPAGALSRGTLTLARYGLAATGNSNYGWFGGGTPGPVATVDRIDFSNDSSTASVRGPLSSAKGYLAATGNSNYGWFGGGTPGPVATVDRIDFSNDSSTASVRGPLSSSRYNLSATGNSNYGWFGGGGPATGPVATVDRIDFSNDSSTASVRSSLSSERTSSAATGNSNYGWFGGGLGPGPGVPVATVNRIDFSNDSSAISVRGPLSSARYYLAATSNT